MITFQARAPLFRPAGDRGKLPPTWQSPWGSTSLDTYAVATLADAWWLPGRGSMSTWGARAWLQAAFETGAAPKEPDFYLQRIVAFLRDRELEAIRSFPGA